MTKRDIVNRIQAVVGFSKKDSEDMFESVLRIMKETLESGETLKISGFGSFVVKDKSPRRGRNPQTGENITLAARRVLTFKASPVLRDAINWGK